MDINEIVCCKRDQFVVNIRRKNKSQTINKKRERNIQLLSKFANLNIQEQYAQIVKQLSQNEDNTQLISLLFRDTERLEGDLKHSTVNSFQFLAIIFEYLLDHQSQYQQSLLNCFEIFLERGYFLMQENKEEQRSIIVALLIVLRSGISIFLPFAHDNNISILKVILLNFFKDYKNDNESQDILEVSFQIIHKIFEVDDQIKVICQLSLQQLKTKKRKLDLISSIFYTQTFVMQTILSILQNVNSQLLNQSIQIIALKILIRLTYWVIDPKFTKPLVDYNLFQSIYNLIDQQNSIEINSLLMKLLRNLIILDYQILRRAFEDKIIEKLLADIFSFKNNIDKNAQVQCLGLIILQLDLEEFDVRDQIDQNYNLIQILEMDDVDKQSKLQLLKSIYKMVNYYNLILDNNNLLLLQKLCNSNDSEIYNSVQMIIQLSDDHTQYLNA